MRPFSPIVVSPVYMPRPTPYCANIVLSLARIFSPASTCPSSATACPCANRKLTSIASAGHSARGARTNHAHRRRGFPTVNFATGHGQAQQVFIDGVRLLLGTHSKAAIFQIRLLIGAGLGVLLTIDYQYDTLAICENKVSRAVSLVTI